MTLVDSSVWIDYFNGKINRHTNLLDGLFGYEEILVGDLILVEVLQGFHSENDFFTANKLLAEFSHVSLVGKEIAYQSIQNYRKLRKNGITIRKTIDVIIGTYCIQHKISLLHADRDFEPMVSYFDLRVL